jgi:hypothetical protein
MRPRDIRDMPMAEAMACILENMEICQKHYWITKTVKKNQGLCACCHYEERVTVCRYCGRSQRMIYVMERQLADERLASVSPLPDFPIGGSGK